MLILARGSMVLLLVWMFFFLMGSLPLLILKHDTPLDARFIRGLFNVYYAAILVTGSVGAVCFALAGRPIVAAALAAIAAIGLAGRLGLVPRMDSVRSTMTADDAVEIRRFRQLHIAGMLLNALLLAAFVAGMTKVSI